jgi:hypothetical protein
LRVVASVQFGIDSLHTDIPVAEKTIPELWSALRLVKRTRNHRANVTDSVTDQRGNDGQIQAI